MSTGGFGYNISESVIEIETWIQWTTTYWVSSGQMTNDVTWPRKVKVMTPIHLGPRQRLEIRTWCQWSTYRKWLPVNQIVMWPMTSRDLERSRLWPQYVWGPLSQKWMETFYNIAPRKWHRGMWLLARHYGDPMCSSMMALHAFTGCVFTSCIRWKKEVNALKILFKKRERLCVLCMANQNWFQWTSYGF